MGKRKQRKDDATEKKMLKKKLKSQPKPKTSRREQERSESPNGFPARRKGRRRVAPDKGGKKPEEKGVKKEEGPRSKGNKKPARGQKQKNTSVWTALIIFILACSLCFLPLFLVVKGCVTSITAVLCDKVCKCPPLAADNT